MIKNKPVALRIKSSVILICLVMIHTLVAAVLVYPGTDNKLPTFTWLNHQAVGGMTVDEAMEQLEESILEDMLILFVDHGGQVVEEAFLPTGSIELQYPYETIIHDLQAVVEADWLQQWIEAIISSQKEKRFVYALEYREKLVLEWLERQKATIEQERRNAAVWVEEGMVVTEEEEPGISLDVAALIDSIQQQMEILVPHSISLTLEVDQPEVTLETLGDYGQELARFSTHLKDDKNRNINIRLAGERVNSARVLPGELFSFNTTVGDIVAEEGFQQAPVIENGRMVMGIGGGVCQASSTLYQTALRAGLTIVERWHHSVPVGYLPMGLDAAVASGSKDLVLKNPYEQPLLIGAWIEGDEYITAFFGAGDLQLPDISVEVRQQRQILPTTSYVEDELLDMGVEVVERQGKKGHWLQVYRVIEHQDGERIEDFISEDHYLPVNQIIRLGTREPSGDVK